MASAASCHVIDAASPGYRLDREQRQLSHRFHFDGHRYTSAINPSNISFKSWSLENSEPHARAPPLALSRQLVEHEMPRRSATPRRNRAPTAPRAGRSHAWQPIVWVIDRHLPPVLRKPDDQSATPRDRSSPLLSFNSSNRLSHTTRISIGISMLPTASRNRTLSLREVRYAVVCDHEHIQVAIPRDLVAHIRAEKNDLLRVATSSDAARPRPPSLGSLARQVLSQ